MADELINTIKRITTLPEGEEHKLRGILVSQSFQKGEVFIHAGSVPSKFAFVVKGLFRSFYRDAKGNEFTKGFFSENSFIVSYTAMVNESKSHYTIEALEDATIDIIDYTLWKTLYANHTCWHPLLVALLEKGFAKKEAREREFLLYNAEERYRSFLQEYPQLEERIKQHLVASYLGITPVALSRIRRSMRVH
jgi:CRP-like cAMP-binding protein